MNDKKTASLVMQKGTLKKWNDEKGFGFIRPENSDEDIFFHISSLQRTTRRPEVGDGVYFTVVADKEGRRKAIDVSIEGVKSVFTERSLGKTEANYHQKKQPRNDSSRRRQYKPRNRSNRLVSNLVAIIVLVAIVLGIDKFKTANLFADPPRSFPDTSKAEEPIIASQFKCEGKTRCNQMTSCEEAMFYLNSCPGSVTDGDSDGLPCEDQWCGH